MMNRVVMCGLAALLIAAALGFPCGGMCEEGTRAAPQGATAQARDQLPFGDLFTPEEMTANFGRHQFTPFGESKLSFEILIPKGWDSNLSEVDPEQLAQDSQAPVPMAEFAPSGADDVGIQVLYIRVPANVDLSGFMDDYVKKNGGNLVTRQHLESKGRTLEDLLMRTNDETLGPMLSRVAAFRSGDVVYIFTGWSVEEKYEKHKRLFGAVLASFNPSGK